MDKSLLLNSICYNEPIEKGIYNRLNPRKHEHLIWGVVRPHQCHMGVIPAMSCYNFLERTRLSYST